MKKIINTKFLFSYKFLLLLGICCLLLTPVSYIFYIELLYGKVEKYAAFFLLLAAVLAAGEMILVAKRKAKT